MIKKPRILIVEDLMSDVDLILDELRLTQVSFEAERADSAQTYLKSLREFAPNIILCDGALPRFNALDALRILHEQNLETPFILYADSLTEERVHEFMKQGVEDYVLKSNLSELPLAILTALKEKESRRAKQKAIGALRKSEYKLKTLLENMSEALLEVDADERIDFVNEQFCRMTGYKRDELLGKVTYDVLFDQEGCKFVSETNLGRSKTTSSRQELCLKKKNGETLWTIAGTTPIADSSGKITGALRVFTDITERKTAEEQLLHDAFHDALTGLANRPLFMHHLRLTIERRKNRSSNLYAVLFLDFDRFKVINDSLGHQEGDKLLKYIARRLETCVRTGDLVARLGGDEFVILLGEIKETSEALLIAERIQNDLKYSFDLAGGEIFISTSIGIALSTAGHRTADDMLRDADIAMYHAKAKGKAQYQVFDQTMHENAVMQLKFETEMRHALDRGEFCLHYQPIFRLEDERLVGFESLVRWNHPERGLIMPNDFISVAEENRLILPLGKWILQESCRRMHRWQTDNPQAAAGLTVSVNLSCKQFLQLDLAEQISTILKTTGLAPRCLKLEITESHIIENTEVAVSILKRLRALGVQISLDDFGTGYSSLGYLQRFPVDYLKIDRSFVSKMVENKENGEIVNTIIKLAQNLKMKVVAEGIETDAQMAQLKQLNCEYGQGYLFSKPLEAKLAEIFILENLKNPSPVASRTTKAAELSVR